MAQRSSLSWRHSKCRTTTMGFSTSYLMWIVLREQRHFIFLPSLKRAIPEQANEHLCLISLQKHSKRSPNVVRCSSPPDLRSNGPSWASNTVWKAPRHLMCHTNQFRRSNKLENNRWATETRNETFWWSYPLDCLRAVPRRQFRSIEWSKSGKNSNSSKRTRQRVWLPSLRSLNKILWRPTYRRWLKAYRWGHSRQRRCRGGQTKKRKRFERREIKTKKAFEANFAET
jgi:hypothetical protein